MALLNLSAINQLAKGVALQKQTVLRDCFNWPASKAMQPDLFVRISKADRQVTNLIAKLELLYQTCLSLSQGIDERWSFEEDDRERDPLAGIRFVFNAETDYDLPPTIEQYQELCELATAYSHYQKTQRHLFQGVTGLYPELSDQGELTLLPRRALTQSAWAQKEYQQEIADIGIEYCLAGYNQFYQQSTRLLQANGDVQQTAFSMLQFIRVR